MPEEKINYQLQNKLLTPRRSWLINGVFFILAFCLLNTSSAIARVYPDYSAEKYSTIKEITLKPGEVKKIKVGFYNRGSYNWRNNGKNFVSLYTYQPKYHKSLLADKTWLSNSHPVKLKDTLAGPNTLGYFEFNIKAPLKEGIYKENFAMAAENKTWIPGGQFELIVTVTSAPVVITTTNEEEIIIINSPESQTDLLNLQASRLSRIDALTLDPNQETSVSILFINKGPASWQNTKITLKDVVAAGASASTSFKTDSWLDEKTVLQNNQDEIKTGNTGIYTIPLKAPFDMGIYTLHFSLTSNDQPISGGNLNIPVTVGSIANQTSAATSILLPQEPNIRIGLFTTEKPLEIQVSGNYELQTATGQVLAVVSETNKITLSFNEDKKNYQATINEQNFISATPLRLVNLGNEDSLVISNYTRNPRWTDNINYNQFRGTLELRQATTGYTWVINELPIENYLKGLGEDVDSAPPEFLKALITAARSYAYFFLQHPTKHIAGNFILDSDNDQVYRGLVREKASPNTIAVVEATCGMVVTYGGKAVETPYFAQTNGRTKSWKEVWGGNKPWLVSVKAQYDKGLKLWGHGVGMSSHDANLRAKKEGLNWEEILKYYYKGIELQKMY